MPLVVALFYWTSNPWADPLAAFVFIFAAITDWVDGYLARKLGVTTPLGEFLDPVADKLMVATALVLLVSKDPHWVIVISAMIIVGREITVSALREWMAHLGARAKVAVSSLGKWKTIVQMTGLSFMVYRNDLFGLPIYADGRRAARRGGRADVVVDGVLSARGVAGTAPRTAVRPASPGS